MKRTLLHGPGRRSNNLISVMLLLAGFASLLSGCGKVKVDETLPPEEQWAQAKADFETEKYLDAIDILNVFTLNYSGSSLIDSAQYLLGECHFALREFILAESEYERVEQSFAQSPLVPEARLKIILCNLYLSPSYSHDQKYTERTASLAQEFLQDFPKSEIKIHLALRSSAGEIVKQIFTLGLWGAGEKSIEGTSLFDTKVVYPTRSRGFGNWLTRVLTLGIYHPSDDSLRIPLSVAMTGDWVARRALHESVTRLAQKNYRSALLYYRQGKYPSAVIYCDRVLELYPDTPWSGPSLKLKGDSHFAMQQYAEAATVFEKYLKMYGAQGRSDTQSKWEACLKHLQTSAARVSGQSKN